MDILAYNRDAWDGMVRSGNRWTVPVSSEEIARAREGEWSVVLTPQKRVPRTWFPEDLRGVEVLALASGGGQQGPVLAAAGAAMTVLDASPQQLAQDRLVAERDGLEITTAVGDMADLSQFAADSFDLIFHPCSNCFVPDVRRVWRQAFRVLRRGGALLSGFCNPVRFSLDPALEEKGILQLKYGIPYSDLTSPSDEERKRYTDKNEPLAFGHTLEDQIGGQIAAGFVITGFFEDGHVGEDALSKLMATFCATRAVKP